MKTYLIKWSNDEETFLKIGVTSKIDERERYQFGSNKIIDSYLSAKEKFKLLMDGQEYIFDDGYQYKALHSEDFKIDDEALVLEKIILKKFHHIKYTPKRRMSGYTECFEYSLENQNKIIECMRKYAKKLKENSPNHLKYLILSGKVRKDDPFERYKAICQLAKG